jgi:hypothetical protein
MNAWDNFCDNMRFATMNIFLRKRRAASALTPMWNESSAQVANAEERWNRSMRMTHLLKSRFQILRRCQLLKATAFVWLSHLLSTFFNVKTFLESFRSKARQDEP